MVARLSTWLLKEVCDGGLANSTPLPDIPTPSSELQMEQERRKAEQLAEVMRNPTKILLMQVIIVFNGYFGQKPWTIIRRFHLNRGDFLQSFYSTVEGTMKLKFASFCSS